MIFFRGELITKLLIRSWIISFLGFLLRLLTRQFVICMVIGICLETVPLCHIFNALHHMVGVFHIVGEEILCFDKYYEICIDFSEQSSNGIVGDGMVQCVDKFDVIGLRMDVYAAAVVKVGGRSDIQVFTHLGLVGNNTKLWTRFLKKWFQEELKCVLYARFRVLWYTVIG